MQHNTGIMRKLPFNKMHTDNKNTEGPTRILRI